MKVDYFSQSKIKSWRKCHKEYDYKYNQDLSRRASPVALLRGTVIHALLEAVIKGTDPEIPLAEYSKTYGELWEEERDKYPKPEVLRGIFDRYRDHWKNDGLIYGGRAEIEVITEYEGMPFRGVIDCLPDDSQGRRWLADHKTCQTIPDEETRFSDIQTVLYYWAARREGIKVDGIMWDYLRTKPPAIPEVLKSGGLSQRANIDTTFQTYQAELLKHNLDFAPYAGILARLKKEKKDAFFYRVYLPKPSEDLINGVVTDFFDTAREMLASDSTARTMTRDCKSCSYYQLCSAEVRGIDSSFIRKQMFVKVHK